MTEEIIIDGVNVAGCNVYKDGHCIDKTAILLCDTNKCSNYKDCYYKQLKRLEQENKELKEQKDILLRQLVINDGEDITVQISQSQFEQYNKYRSALEEIIQIFLHQVAWVGQLTNFEEEIYNKINECLGE